MAMEANEEGKLPWVEKYRPQGLEDIISNKDIIDTINKFVDANRLPHLLLHGPPGTGKTTTIQAMARKIYGPQYNSMVLQLNASDDRGINVVREKIKSFASTRQMFRYVVVHSEKHHRHHHHYHSCMMEMFWYCF
jgi:replication factor C subunit 3/5